MAEMHCSRCDRVREPDELRDLGELVGSVDHEPYDRPLLRDPGPWASIDGVDVCPQCQTSREQEEIARRAVAMVEADVARSQDEHSDRTRGEAALIAFAMLLRERLDSLRRRALAADEPSAATQTTGTKLCVAVTGAFLTGHPVRVRISGYDELRAKIGEELEREDGRGWSVDSLDWRRGGTYESGGGFATMLPLVLARRDGGDMLARTEAALRRWCDEHDDWLDDTQGWGLTASSLRIDVYDLGMAVMNGTLEVRLPTNASLPTAARTLNRLVRLKPEPESRISSPIV